MASAGHSSFYTSLKPRTISEFEIVKTIATGKCVEYATSVTLVTVRYNLMDLGRAIFPREETYATALSKDLDSWGIHPNGDFPVTLNCSINLQGNIDYLIQ